MIWSLGFRFRQYWMGSLWLIPALLSIVSLICAQAMVQLDKSLDSRTWLVYDSSTAMAILAALLSASITFTGFVFTMLLLVPQFGGSQLSARVLQLLYRDPKLKLIFGIFLAATVYIFTLLLRMRGDFVPGLSLWLAGVMVFANVLLFLGFVSYFVQHLRPATAAANVAAQGLRVLDSIYPRPFTHIKPSIAHLVQFEPDIQVETLRHVGESGVILAISVHGLCALAERVDSVFVVERAVGEYIANGSTIITIVGGNQRVTARHLTHLIALGNERTFEQDPRFALRVLVDIAAKALSPAINDPTTAVNVIDRIEDLLVQLSRRDLAIGEIRDRQGRLRVVLPTPSWSEYVQIAVTEIRMFGKESIQVAARLNAMLQDLDGVVPVAHKAAIEAELAKLHESIDLNFALESDRQLAIAFRRVGAQDRLNDIIAGMKTRTAS